MTVVTTLDTITQWVRERIAPKIKLKVPPQDESAPTDAGYDYQLANPAVFELYVPTKEKLAPGILSPIPSICVRFAEGSDDLSKYSGAIGVELYFSAWDPGTHGRDILLPVEGKPLERKQWTGPEAEAYFRRNGDGWRDAWNAVDFALREIERATNINGLVIDRRVPIRYGPLREQEAIPDYYPFWFAWISFSVTQPLVRSIEGVDELL